MNIIARSRTTDVSPSDWSTGQDGLATLPTSSLPGSKPLCPPWYHPKLPKPSSYQLMGLNGQPLSVQMGPFLKIGTTPLWGRNLSVSLPPLSPTIGQLNRALRLRGQSGMGEHTVRPLTRPPQSSLGASPLAPQGIWRKVAGQRPRGPDLSGGWGLNSCQSDPNLSLMPLEC